MRTAFITGTGGFIGFHLADLLLQEGWRIASLDGMTDYYDVQLKERRLKVLRKHSQFSFTQAMLEDNDPVLAAISSASPDVIVHLAAQAGVRYSLENPRAYIDANIVGTLNVMEAARETGVSHLLMASTSSVYGANEQMAPFRIVNIGNSRKVKLLDFVKAIEAELEIEAKRNYMEMQKGDVPATWADGSLLAQITGYQPATDLSAGIKAFVNWYRDYYDV